MCYLTIQKNGTAFKRLHKFNYSTSLERPYQMLYKSNIEV